MRAPIFTLEHATAVGGMGDLRLGTYGLRFGVSGMIGVLRRVLGIFNDARYVLAPLKERKHHSAHSNRANQIYYPFHTVNVGICARNFKSGASPC